MKLKDIAYDPAASTDGVWIKYPGSDIECLTARMFNREMVEWVDRMRREHADPITGEVSDDDLTEITFEATVRFVCKDWRNVQDDDGEDLPYSLDVARDRFQKRDGEFGHFYNWWLNEAQKKERYLAKTIHEQAKKSKVSSNGRGGGAITSTSSEPGMKKTATQESSPAFRGSRAQSR